MLIDWSRCPVCNGRGKTITRQCGTCHSNKVINTDHNIAVHIPAGAPEGFEEVFHGEADESTEWEAGDVIVRVRSKHMESAGDWSRKDGGLIGRVTLSVAEVSLKGYFALKADTNHCVGAVRVLTDSDTSRRTESEH